MNQRQINQASSQSGFTLIELSLAMSFIAVLLLTIAMTIIQMGTIYNRGMALKEVNQSARDISDDFRRTFAASEAFAASADGTDTADTIIIKDGAFIVGGRACLGSYTYIWNTAKARELSHSKLARYETPVGSAGSAVSFVKVADKAKEYCEKSGSSLTKVNIPFDEIAASTELLKIGDRNLGVQALSIASTPSAYDPLTGKRIYTINYVLGTGETSAMNDTQTACLPPGDPKANLTYCNVQLFTIALTAGDGVN